MAYYRLPEKELRAYCETVMGKYGFNEKQSRDIADILLTADLQGLEWHGVQRLIRYHRGVKSGVIRPDAVPEVVHETPLSVVLDAHSAMGQIAAGNGNKDGYSIRAAALDVLKEQNISDARVRLTDRGALDCVIRARVETAVARAKGE